MEHDSRRPPIRQTHGRGRGGGHDHGHRHGHDRPTGGPPMENMVGTYKIGEQIGKGSFACVFKATNTQTGKFVAVKAIVRSLLKKRLLDNLDTEIHIMKSLKHPHVVQLYECVQTTSHFNLIMEYCALGDLNTFICRRDRISSNPIIAKVMAQFPCPSEGGLNEVLVRHFLKQISSAIAFMRTGNFVHRDLKPQNLLLCPPCRSESEALELGYAGRWDLPVLKLADFGFARILPSTSMAETLCGSPLYMAPEILRYEKYDAKADLWSIGAILYELSMGKAPFRAQNYVELIRKIDKNEDRIRFSEAVPVSEPVKQLIRSLLKRNPVERMSFQDFFQSEAVVGDIPDFVDSNPFVQNVDNEPTPSTSISPVNNKPVPSAPSSVIPAELQPLVSTRKSESISSRSAKPASPSNNTPVEVSPLVRTPQVPIPQRKPSTASIKNASGPGSSSPQKPVSSFGNRRSSLEQRAAISPDVQKSPVAEMTTERSKSRSRSRHSSGASIDGQPGISNPLSRTPSTGKQNPHSRAEQDILLEKEYVVVEKRTVVVNALADEMMNSPNPLSNAAVLRRASSSRHQSFSSTAGAAMQRVGISPDQIRHGETTSTLARALAMASARLFSPTSPSRNLDPVMSFIGNGAMDESEADILSQLQETAAKSSAVYDFANVKFFQLMPGSSTAETGLTHQAVRALSEEALALYVKCLSLLASVMDQITGWWSRNKSRTVSQDVLNSVGWIRDRFNETLDRAEIVRIKLSDTAVRQIESDNERTRNDVTADKLLYDRAVEMSRSAVMNEIVEEDLGGCQTMYETSIWMLKAILDDGTGRDNLDSDDRHMVETLIRSLKGRLAGLHKKIETLISSPIASAVSSQVM
ncbi:kinase-like domain-containing protein [Lipomyces oligophaga]|uniref:kinase-like domain-containing protein n=1 Tax=Lipomyces oligophaga TaxID=45792 RepID=UPI0034CE0C40